MIETNSTESHTTAKLRFKAERESDPLPSLMIAADKAVQNILTGEHNLRKAGLGERFWQFRDYDPSDRPQDIDWRQSAKGDSVFVREREQQNAQNVLFWCSTSQSMDFVSNKDLPSKKQAAQILSLATAMLLARGHETVQLIGGSMLPGRSENAIQRMAEDLIAMPDSNLDEIGHKRIQPNSAFIAISDFLNDVDNIRATFVPVSESARKGLLIHVLDPAELELPYNGNYIFEGIADTAEKIDNVSSIRAAYQQRIQAHIEDLQNIARQCGWDIVLHTTDMDIGASLFKIWMYLKHDERGL